MKKFVSLAALLILICGFTTVPKSSEEESAMRTIQGFYDGMKAFDYNKIGQFCTDDFFAIDAGIYYKNLDEFIANLKNYEGAKMDISLDLLRSDFEGKQGLLIIKFSVSAELNGEIMKITALENYVVKKRGGEWLIYFIHSTPIES